MPRVTFERLSHPALSPTCMCVQLADLTIQYPEGIVKNLLLRVKDSFILVDFVVLDMEEQIYQIHQDAKGQGIWAKPEWFEDWEIHHPPTTDPTPTPPKLKKNKRVWRKKKTSSSSTYSSDMDDLTSI
jgi:hypothetical protein